MTHLILALAVLFSLPASAEGIYNIADTLINGWYSYRVETSREPWQYCRADAEWFANKYGGYDVRLDKTFDRPHEGRVTYWYSMAEANGKRCEFMYVRTYNFWGSHCQGHGRVSNNNCATFKGPPFWVDRRSRIPNGKSFF